MNTAVSTQRLTKTFRDFWGRTKVTAVRNLMLDIPAGCVFGLLGPNGSGKTTTLKLLTGLLHPSSGSATVLGDKPDSIAVRRRLGYLPESSSLYPRLSARDNLRFYAGIFGFSGHTARRRTEELLELVDLMPSANRPVGEFSKGMARRAGLAQALINDPDLLILDEPTAGLDPSGCRQVKDLLRARADAGKTVVVSSHLLADVEDICDEVCILHHGNAIANGRLDVLLERPEQIRFTADGLRREQIQELQEAFRRITGREASVDHPRLSLETFFAHAVGNAEQSEQHA